MKIKHMLYTVHFGGFPMYEERLYLKHQEHFFDEFEFKNGSCIENAKVDYGIVGTPKYDDEGNIINAILFCPGFKKDYSTIVAFNYLAEKNSIFDKEEYFFISITPLGFPESYSPSTSGLKNNFPKYEIEDLVNFQKQLIEEKFPDIKRLNGIIGYATGGFTALGWSIFYPDLMDFVIHFNSGFKSSGYKYIYATLSNTIIEKSSGYSSEIYDSSVSDMLILISQLHYLMSFSRNHFYVMSSEEIDTSIENFADESLFFDIYDLKFSNDFILSFDLESQLDKIKCKLLIIGVGNTNYYIPEFDSIPIHEAVEGSTYLFLDVGDDSNISEHAYKIIDDVKEFLSSV